MRFRGFLVPNPLNLDFCQRLDRHLQVLALVLVLDWLPLLVVFVVVRVRDVEVIRQSLNIHGES